MWMEVMAPSLCSRNQPGNYSQGWSRQIRSRLILTNGFISQAPVELSIFCFRHLPAQLRNESPEAIDAFNERLLVALQRDGSSYLSNATLGGRFALRGCVLNYRTTLRDMEILLDDLRRVAKSLRIPA
jgi:aromatic-L-amino-acid/L-tryptophan decarboxylase